MPIAKKVVSNENVKVKSIDTILRNIEKSMKNTGAPVVVKAPTMADFANVPVISFGYTDVDNASFCGGIPQGKMVEIFGTESGGKSYLSLKLIASAQKSGMAACLVDAENSYDPVWANSHGVETDSLYIMRSPLPAETILEYVDKLCESGVFGLIVIDSTAALIPRAELEGSIEDQKVAELARAMSRACRKIVSNCSTTNTTVVFLNQIRDKVGIMFGNPETTPGGKALRFYSHQRIKVTPGKKVTVKEGEKDIVIARQSWVQFVKNKSARPFGECVIEIVFDQTARNPVVKLCKAAKEFKIISIRDNTYRLSKELFEDAKKNIDTEKKTNVELADYLVKNDLVQIVLQAYIEKHVEEHDDESKIDPSILEIRDNPALIVSPMEGAIVEVDSEVAPEITDQDTGDGDLIDIDE